MTTSYTEQQIAKMGQKDLVAALDAMEVDYMGTGKTVPKADTLRSILLREQAKADKAAAKKKPAAKKKAPAKAETKKPAAKKATEGDNSGGDSDDLDAALGDANAKTAAKKAAKKQVDRVGRSGSRGWALMMLSAIVTEGPVSLTDLYKQEEADLYRFGRGGNPRTESTVEVRAREFRKYGRCFGVTVNVSLSAKTLEIDRKKTNKSVLKAMDKAVGEILTETEPPADFKPPALQGSDKAKAARAKKKAA